MSSPQEFGIQVAKCCCQERSFHVSVYPPQHMSMSCHVICVHRPHGGVNWSSIRSSNCVREAGISMQSVLWFSQQYHYNTLFTGHVLTSPAIFWLPLQRCAANSITNCSPTSSTTDCSPANSTTNCSPASSTTNC